MGYRIEALRVYLENNLGDQVFKSAYMYLTNLNNNDDEENDEIESIIGRKKAKFVPLIHHLIVCEDSYYSN